MAFLEIHQGLTELTAPAVEPVTTAEAKTWMRVDTSADDSLIGVLIKGARRYAEKFTGRSFVATQWRVRMDGFPDDRAPILLPRPPLLYVKNISYVASGAVLATTGLTYTVWGDRVMEIDVTPATVESDDVFSVLVGGVAIATFTATGATVANVTAGLETAWNASTHDFASGITAVDQTTYLELKGATGQGFAVTTSTTDGGGTDAQTLTAATIQNERTLYTTDNLSEPARIEPVPTADWPDTSDDFMNAQIDFVAGYGGASDVPEDAKTAINLLVSDMYEHREAQSEIMLHGNRAANDLLWALRVLNVY